MNRAANQCRALVRKIRVGLDLLGEHGPAKLALRILPWLLDRRYLLYALDLGGLGPCRVAALPVRLTEAGPADLPLLLSIRPGFYEERVLRERLGSGHLCFIGWLGDKPVHLRWAFVGGCELSYLDRTLILSPGECLSDEVYTVPAFRGMGIYRACSDLSRERLRRAGFRRYLVFFASWDGFLIKEARLKGLKPIGEARRRMGLPGGRRRLELTGALRDRGGGSLSVEPD